MKKLYKIMVPFTCFMIITGSLPMIGWGLSETGTPVEVVSDDFNEKTVTLENMNGAKNIIEIKYLEPTTYISDSDLNLLALLTMAEAEGECEEGKRLVIDTVLNRVDSEHFPNTIQEVILQKSQFTSMHNGRVERVRITEEVVRLIEEEIKSRTNYDVMFFHADYYGKYGTPLFSVGNHYFSSYE